MLREEGMELQQVRKWRNNSEDGEKNRRVCPMYCMIATALTVIVAAVIALVIGLVLVNRDDDGPPVTTSSPSMTTQALPPNTTKTSIGLSLSFNDRTFTEDLNDNTSIAYTEVVDEVTSAIDDQYRDDTNYLGVEITDISPGSIRISLIILFWIPVDLHERVNVLDEILPTVEEKVLDAIYHISSSSSLQVTTSPCEAKPCANNGICEAVENSSDFTCTCLPGYTSKACQTDIDDCVGIVCLNGGTCEDQVNSYRCLCTEGYESFLCGSACKSYEFQCFNDNCVPFSDLCDGVDQCGDGSDELTENCRYCPDNYFQCRDFSVCLAQNLVCDGFAHCRLGNDEWGCVTTVTSSGVTEEPGAGTKWSVEWPSEPEFNISAIAPFSSPGYVLPNLNISDMISVAGKMWRADDLVHALGYGCLDIGPRLNWLSGGFVEQFCDPVFEALRHDSYDEADTLCRSTWSFVEMLVGDSEGEDGDDDDSSKGMPDFSDVNICGDNSDVNFEALEDFNIEAYVLQVLENLYDLTSFEEDNVCRAISGVINSRKDIPTLVKDFAVEWLTPFVPVGMEICSCWDRVFSLLFQSDEEGEFDINHFNEIVMIGVKALGLSSREEFCFDLGSLKRNNVSIYVEDLMGDLLSILVDADTCKTTADRVLNFVLPLVNQTRGDIDQYIYQFLGFHSVDEVCNFLDASFSSTLPVELDGCGLRPVMETGEESLTILERNPWQVALYASDEDFTCDGSIIASDWVVTAAHCVESSSHSFKVQAGSETRKSKGGGQIREVSDVYIHKFFNKPSYLENDIALLKLSSPLNFTNEVRPVCLPNSGDNPNVGTYATVTGWGSYNDGPLSDYLQEATQLVIPNEVCMQTAPRDVHVLPSMLCTLYDTSQQASNVGGSGAPLVQENGERWTLYGVMSWGEISGSWYQPLGMTRVSFFLDFISETIRNNK